MAVPSRAKTCSSCKQEKSLDNFGKRPEYKDGYRGQCNACRNTQTKKYFATDHGQQVRKAHTAKNRIARNEARANGVTLRWDKLRAKYKITPEDYDALHRKQGGRCGICGTTSPGGRFDVFVVDHCHATGRVRGLLCNSCNTALGKLGDTAESVQRALQYLQRGS